MVCSDLPEVLPDFTASRVRKSRAEAACICAMTFNSRSLRKIKIVGLDAFLRKDAFPQLVALALYQFSPAYHPHRSVWAGRIVKNWVR
jgi:hypothetical protein